MLLAVPTRVEQARSVVDRPWANGLMVSLNVLIFVLWQTPAWFLIPSGPLWNVFTYAFSHATPWHLIGNMYVLLIVGNAVNRRIGNGPYLAVYFGVVVVMGILGRMVGVGPLMGSSGVLFAMLGVMLLLLPAAWMHIGYVALLPITLLIGLFYKPEEPVGWFLRFGQFSLRAWIGILFVPALEIWSFAWWRFTLGNWPWMHPAHLLGLICGVAAVLLMPQKLTMGSAN